MGFLRGRNSAAPLSQQPTILQAIRIQTSAFGQVIPVVLGTGRISGKLLGYWDFKAIPHTNPQASGGKGGATPPATQQTTFTYQAAVQIGLCRGAIAAILSVWDTKGKLALLSTTETFVVPGGATHTCAPPSSGSYYQDQGVSSNTAYSQLVDDYGSDGAITLAGTYLKKMPRNAGAPPVGQYTHNPSTGVYTFNAADVGKTVSITYVYSVPNTNSNGQPLTQLALTLFTGAQGQSPWGYLTTNHPGQDLAYSMIAHVDSASMDLGSSATLPNYSFEVAAQLMFGAGIPDCNPADIVNFILTDTFDGGGFNPAQLGSLTQFSNYCLAMGIFLTLIMDTQRKAADYLNQILKLTNSEAVWSEGLLKIVPYGDTSAAANGAIFIPNTTPIYEFNDEDFYTSGPGDEPVKMAMVDPKLATNVCRVEILDRANEYNPALITDKDEANIQTFSEYPAATITAHEINTRAIGAIVAYAINRRSVNITRTFKFTVPLRYLLLDPMDLVLINDVGYGLVHHPVRITSIKETDKQMLEIEAEDFPYGTANSVLYAKQVPGGFIAQSNADPGLVNIPIVFEANDRLTSLGEYELWFGISGASKDWGGCTIWISTDGSNYKAIGRKYGASRMGVLTTNVAATADPDTTSTIGVDLTSSLGTLGTGTASDADNYHTLFLVGAELMSYQTATLTAVNKYNLTTRIRRGVFNSPLTTHAIGDQFLRLDDAIFIYPFDPSWIGKTVHLKFTSFNTFGLMEQSLANVTDYTYVVGGLFNNTSQIVANNATVDSVGTGGPPFTAATVRAYGKVAGVPTPGTALILTKQDGSTRSITAVNVTGQALSTVYYVMINPADGSTYLLTSYSTMVAATFNGHICVGSTTTVAAGGGGTPGGGGGGDGGGCPEVSQLLRDGLQIGEADLKTVFDCINPKTLARQKRRPRALKLKKKVRCFRLTSKDGTEWVGAWDTLFETFDARLVQARHMMGELVITDGGPDTRCQWSTIISVENVGLMDVVSVDLNNSIFACGTRANKRMYSHNNKPAPDLP